MMLPAMNLNERVLSLNIGRANMPPEAFQAAMKLAEQILTADDFAVLKAKLAIE